MIKVAIIGPESTGKTELCLQLATYFKAPYELEYAREYVEQLKQSYTFEDVVTIAKKQIEQELFYEKNPSQADFLFFDTELIIIKVWFEHCYNTVPDFVQQRLEVGFFDLYLLCSPDLIWQADAVRENGGENRKFFFEWYKREIEKLGKAYNIIEGEGALRTENAIRAIKNFSKKNAKGRNYIKNLPKLESENDI